MIDDMLAGSVGHLFGDCCTPRDVRKIEAGASPAPLWRTILESGFADALVPESAGGAGLGLGAIFAVVAACGRFALPLPLAQTMAARAFLAREGSSVPEGPIALAFAAVGAPAGSIACSAVPYGRVAEWVLVADGDCAVLLPATAAERTLTGVHGSLEADLHWNAVPADARRFPARIDWRALGACLLAAQIAGAMERAFAMTVQYANERVQFGRSIGKFQAIQQQVSVMAEHVSATRMAAQLGMASESWTPSSLAAAVAKSRSSEAVPLVAAIAHAVHGAMGITEEYDLQLFTRRMHEWRRAFGSEGYWNARLGGALIDAQGMTALEFIRERIFPSA